jgi:hypothetical protein
MVQLTYKHDSWWRTDPITTLLIRYVCYGDSKTIELLTEYLVNTPITLRSAIRQLMKEQKYQMKFLGLHQKRTTRNAVKLAERVRRELGLWLYPSIKVCATKGWMDAGCWKWAMRNLMSLTDIGSSDSVRQCLKKSNQLIIVGDEIYAESSTYENGRNRRVKQSRTQALSDQTISLSEFDQLMYRHYYSKPTKLKIRNTIEELSRLRNQQAKMVKILRTIYADCHGRCPEDIDLKVWANLTSLLKKLEGPL